MDQIKKSFNIPEDLSERIDSFIEANPGTNFTFIAIQALEIWLKNPQISLRAPIAPTARTSVQKVGQDLHSMKARDL